MLRALVQLRQARTITQVLLSEFGKSYTVYHLETDAHELILANGAMAETFVDNVSRRAFDNFAEFEELYGDQPDMKELPYPRTTNARHLPLRIKNRLGMDASKIPEFARFSFFYSRFIENAVARQEEKTGEIEVPCTITFARPK